MPHIVRHALVPYTAEQMYALVDDIKAYPSFLPWCRSTKELARSGSEVTASIEIAKGALNKSFTTVNQMTPGEMIEIKLVNGPFKRLQGSWAFDTLREDACKVTLDMNFEFSSRVAAMLIGPIFNHIVNTLVDSFVRRARQVYG